MTLAERALDDAEAEPVVRRCAQHPAPLGRHVEIRPEPGCQRCELARRHVHVTARHALGATRGATGVEQRRAHRTVGCRLVGLIGEPRLVVLAQLDDLEASRDLGGLPADLGVLAVRDEQTRTRIDEELCDLPRGEVPVERHVTGVCTHVTQHQLGPFDAVRGEDAVRLTRPDATGVQTVGDATRAVFELLEGQRGDRCPDRLVVQPTLRLVEYVAQLLGHDVSNSSFGSASAGPSRRIRAVKPTYCHIRWSPSRHRFTSTSAPSGRNTCTPSS